MEKLEVSKEFILEAYESACSNWKVKLEKEFPTVFVKEEFEVGKWYFVYNALKDYNALILKGDKMAVSCGFWLDNNVFFGNGGWGNLDKEIKREAPHKEVETALINEAKKRGFKEGMCIVQPFNDDNFCCISGSVGFNFNNNDLWFGGSRIFSNGNWAKIIEQLAELTLEQRIENLENQLKQLK